MAAWEFGAGRMPHWAAAAFCAPLILLGLLWSPARIFAAFTRGLQSRTLHGSDIAPLLGAPLSAAYAASRDDTKAGGIPLKRARFAFLVAKAATIAAAPIIGALGVWLIWAAC